jgi:1-acyl-sn-glycerol-3-phosphate acyltransferase
MGLLRAIVRAALLCIFTAVMYLLVITGKFLLSPYKKLRLDCTGLMLRSWARGLCFVLGINITRYGQPPAAPFILVSNHLSYVDILVFASQVACVFIAKKDVASWPAIGSMCRAAGTIFVDRESRRDVVRVNQLIEHALNEGLGIILFPEGTSTEGAGVRPFNPSLLDYAAKNEMPVYHASISYRTVEGDPPAYLSVCWWGDMTFMSHFGGLLKLRSVHATVLFGMQPISRHDRKSLAAELHNAVISEFVPVVDLEETCKTAVQ